MKEINEDILPFPKVVRIEPSSLCNLKCIHCPTGTLEKRAQFQDRSLMEMETFQKIISSLKNNIEYIKVVVLYHGGEPFLNKRLTEFVHAQRN